MLQLAGIRPLGLEWEIHPPPSPTWYLNSDKTIGFFILINSLQLYLGRCFCSFRLASVWMGDFIISILKSFLFHNFHPIWFKIFCLWRWVVEIYVRTKNCKKKSHLNWRFRQLMGRRPLFRSAACLSRVLCQSGISSIHVLNKRLS